MLCLEPEMMVPTNKSLLSLCHVCYSMKPKDHTKEKFICCKLCKLVHYCSLACKKFDEFLHTQECKSLIVFQKNFGMIAHDKIRLVSRIMWERKRKDAKWWNSIQSLLTHREDTRQDFDYLTKVTNLSHYVTAVDYSQEVETQLENCPTFAFDDFDELLGRVLFASFKSGSMNEGTSSILSVTAAMMNHSCVSNTIVVFPHGLAAKKCFHVVAVKDVKAGEELTYAYSDSSRKYASRQEQLQRNFFFTCKCPLCTQTELVLQGKSNWVDPREAVYCGRLDGTICKGLVAVSSDLKPYGACNLCKLPSKWDVATVSNLLTEGYTKLKEAQDTPHHLGE